MQIVEVKYIQTEGVIGRFSDGSDHEAVSVNGWRVLVETKGLICETIFDSEPSSEDIQAAFAAGAFEVVSDPYALSHSLLLAHQTIARLNEVVELLILSALEGI